MSRFMKWLLSGARTLLAEFFIQIFALVVFGIAVVAWLYFSTIYAAILVIVLGIALGTYLYGLIEGEGREENKLGVKKHQDSRRS